MSSSGPGTDAPPRGPVARRTRAPEEIERILRQDAIDAPTPYFSPRLLRTAVRDLLAPSPDVFFITAEVQGRYAGFVFSHALGPGMWRDFARRHVFRHPVALGMLMVRLHLLVPLRRKLARRRGTPVGDRTSERTKGVPVSVPKSDKLFAWTRGTGRVGQVDMLFVRDDCRGLGVAPAMLHCAIREMARRDVTLAEAHVDPGNYSSVRAFLKAGWTGIEMSDGDFYVSTPVVPVNE
jgi:GNAT superfamily N-acetyltransferase